MPAFVTDNARLVWSRLTLSKITIAYSLFTFAHCIIQVALQADAFVINTNADNFLKKIMKVSKLPESPPGIDLLVKDGPLYRCLSIKDCNIVWAPPGSKATSGALPNGPVYAVDGTASSTHATYATTLSALNGAAVVVASSTPSPTPTNAPVVVSTVVIQEIITVTEPATPQPTQAKVDNDDDDDDNDNSPSTLVVSNDVARVGLHGSTLRRAGVVGQPSFSTNGSLVFIPVSHVKTVPKSNATANDLAPNEARLSATCVEVLAWPIQKLGHSGREDIVFLAFNIWVLGMSLVAILNESMPHIIAAVLTHLLTTGWTAFQIVHTSDFRREFLRITRDGACPGVNLLPSYWEHRAGIELAQLVLNCVALLMSAFLSWRLVKQFGWQTFKRVGANMTVNHMYRLVLGLSVVLQLALFFIVTSMALWIDQITRGAAVDLSDHVPSYAVSYFLIIAGLVPWAACGWHGVRHESKEITLVFLIGSIIVLVSWAGMFISDIFRLVFVAWPFFAMIGCIAIALSAITLGLGIMCRLNFGKGVKALSMYLSKDEVEQDRKRDITNDLENSKAEFPANDVPTYASMFSNNIPTPREIPVPTAAHAREHIAGRGYQPSRYADVSHERSRFSTSSGPASPVSPEIRISDAYGGHDLARTPTYSSVSSNQRSIESNKNHEPSGSSRSDWVIE